MFQPTGLTPVSFESCEAIAIGPGCTRRDLPSRPGVRVWIVEIAPGSEWPRVDRHGEGGEDVFVLDGEVIEGDERFGVGTYLHFDPDSQHRPRTETGVRLIGFNLL
ncbi:cupin domain-containing protein [Sphingopyxis granuli]|uniref:cupin domain-containing protein n=1 Tax=Sphingopyxis granuli TaxID=267128 RepID=UPI001F53D0F3|nr:cupin domain-containing protein [Sphingopyxis granuli]UNK79103.1 cupin domain-containing protein [Sphingopyxis granuli]